MDISELQRLDPTKPINRHPWEIVRADIISFFLSRNQKHAQHIVDFGSGDAFVLNQLVKKGYANQYSAVDSAYNQEIIEFLEGHDKTSPVRFFTSSEQIDAGSGKADCFLMLDVLEHCKDDHAVLNAVTTGPLAADNSLFIITVPAFQSLFSAHDVLLHHYRRYNRKQLSRLVKNNSLEIIQSGYFFNSLIPVRLTQLLLEKLKLRKPVSSLDKWKGNKMITSIFYAILWADFRVSQIFTKIGLRLPGLSCYCICRKLPS